MTNRQGKSNKGNNTVVELLNDPLFVVSLNLNANLLGDHLVPASKKLRVCSKS
jgi:hypothetical protein